MNYFALIVTIIFPPLGIPIGLVGIANDSRHRMAYIFCIAFAFAMFAYSYQAIVETDIVRYWSFIEADGQLGFKEMLVKGRYGIARGEYLFVINAVFWFFGKIGLPRMVPALSTFIVYYISFYITVRIGSDHEARRSALLFYIMFCVVALNFYSISNNVRNIMAFQLMSLAVFRDVYEKKRNLWTYILYVLPLFIHTSSVLLLLFRVFLRIEKRIKAVGVAAVVLVKPVLFLLYPLSFKMEGSMAILGRGIQKGFGYFMDTSSSWGLEVQASGSERLFKLLYMLIVIVMCACCVLAEKRKIQTSVLEYGIKDREWRLFNNYVFYIGLAAVACIPMLRPEYWRFAAIMIALGGGIFFKDVLPFKAERAIVWLALVPVALCCMALWIRNMTIYADGLGTLKMGFVSSPFIIIFRDLLHLL